MIARLPAESRGTSSHGWLDSKHTFSFADWYEPRRMGFRSLRVINDDRVAGGAGFGVHGHRDMEIISYVLDGALEHQDSLGTRGVLRPGDVQRMSAGTGVRHSEYNGSPTEEVHFLQIWLLPERPGLTPSYEQKHFPDSERRNRLRPLVTPDARDGSLKIHQDAALFGTLLDPGQALAHPLAPGRHAYVHVARGGVELNGQRLVTGDGAAISEETELRLVAFEPSEVLLFDLA